MGLGFSSFLYSRTNKTKKVLYITYLRRKYLPYWVIQEVSKKYNSIYFTVIASCPDFIGGPGGIVKIEDGQILESYGFFGKRQNMLNNPNPDLIFTWFKKGGYEETYRNKKINIHPKKCDVDSYIDNLVDFTDSEENEIDNVSISAGINWNRIKTPNTG